MQFLNVQLEKLSRTIFIVLICTIYLSVLLVFVFDLAGGFLGSGPGGRHGLYVSRWLNAFMGKLGTGFFLAIFLFALILFTNKNSQKNLTIVLSIGLLRNLNPVQIKGNYTDAIFCNA